MKARSQGGWRWAVCSMLVLPSVLHAAVLAHWSFDSNLTDESGNNRTLTSSGGAAVTLAQSRFGGGSLRTDGANDFVYRNDSAFDFGTSDFALSFWYLRGNNDNLDSLLGQGSSIANDGYLARIDGATDANAQLQMILDDNGAYRAGALAPAGDNATFQHVVMQRNGDLLQIYVNGALFASDTGNDNVDISASGYAFAIGARNIFDNGTTAGQENFFNGWIDEVWVYDSALSQSEITDGFLRNFAQVPEPGVFSAALIGALILRFMRRRRSRIAYEEADAFAPIAL